ncbi:PaaI family thioesterase [Marinibaculum pumilum]|uniref:PaaI family thioesterase n=1 Tax=Marinibaculum pumilum TaxID=1766165 RepID=A0ABV7L6B9_9PROT
MEAAANRAAGADGAEGALPDGVSIAKVEAYFAEVLPLFGLFGLRLDVLEPGRAEIVLRPEARALRPGGGVAGPVMFAMADAGLYAAIFGLRGIVPMAVTSDLGMHFLRAARSAEIRCAVEITKAGRRMAYGDARLTDAEGRLVARGSGSYALPLPGEEAPPGAPAPS